MDDEASFIDMVTGMGLVIIVAFSLMSMVIEGFNYANVLSIIFVVLAFLFGDKRSC